MKVMLGRIHFIGGIHGVGKSTICRKICAVTNLTYLSASALLRWAEINPDPRDKKVINISMTQMRLIDALERAIRPNTSYLLDGHYCLLDGEGKITPITQEVFIQINPASLGVIIGDIATVSRRLEQRDGKKYEQTLLREMQRAETDHARRMCLLLGLPLSVGREGDFSEMVSIMTRQINQS